MAWALIGVADEVGGGHFWGLEENTRAREVWYHYEQKKIKAVQRKSMKLMSVSWARCCLAPDSGKTDPRHPNLGWS